jgi:hypothetical protein
MHLLLGAISGSSKGSGSCHNPRCRVKWPDGPREGFMPDACWRDMLQRTHNLAYSLSLSPWTYSSLEQPKERARINDVKEPKSQVTHSS